MGDIIVEEFVSFDCKVRERDFLRIEVWWNASGPPEKTNRLAAIVDVFLADSGYRALVVVEQDVEVDRDFMAAMFRVFGIRPGADVQVVNKANVVPMGYAKAH